jgi:hypothetical protein
MTQRGVVRRFIVQRFAGQILPHAKDAKGAKGDIFLLLFLPLERRSQASLTKEKDKENEKESNRSFAALASLARGTNPYSFFNARR